MKVRAWVDKTGKLEEKTWWWFLRTSQHWNEMWTEQLREREYFWFHCHNFCGWIQIWALATFFFVTPHKKQTNSRMWYVAGVWMKAGIANISPWLMISRPSAWTEFKYARSITAPESHSVVAKRAAGGLAWRISPNIGGYNIKKGLPELFCVHNTRQKFPIFYCTLSLLFQLSNDVVFRSTEVVSVCLSGLCLCGGLP